MGATRTTDDALAAVLCPRWDALSRKFMDLAQAIPDEGFERQLVNGTRTCADVLRHVAYWNLYAADGLNGRKADDSANELPPEEYPTKASILAEMEKANRTIANEINRDLDAKRLALICMAFEHLSEHYGQLAVYARLLGIVPPASRS